MLRSTWAETQATWNVYKTGSSWGTIGCGSSTTDYTTSGQASATVPASEGYMQWTVTTQVQWAQSNSAYVHVRLVDISETSSYECEFFSREFSGTDKDPQLIITYTAPSPTVTTGSVTGITDIQAVCNATATSIPAITQRGIQYGLTQTPTWSNNESGSFVSGQFSRTLTGLSAGTTYWYRGFAVNEGGTGYGSWTAFTTLTTPTLITLNATYVGVTTARLNGQLTDDGGDSCEVRFEYGEAPSTYLFSTTWAAQIEGAFYADISSLKTNTTYYYRAQAKNSIGTVNSTELNFTTVYALLPPTSFVAHATSGTEVSLAWIQGAGATNTLIQVSAGTYPISPGSGTTAYSGPLSSVVTTNLTAGITYYFSAWSESGGNYSDNYTQALATTLAGTPVSTPTTPSQPSNWFLSPDYTLLVNLPFYNQALALYDAYNLPYNTGWFILALFIAALAGAIAYFASNGEIWSTLITLVAVIVVESLIGMVGMWIVLFILIIGGTYAYVKARPA